VPAVVDIDRVAARSGRHLIGYFGTTVIQIGPSGADHSSECARRTGAGPRIDVDQDSARAAGAETAWSWAPYAPLEYPEGSGFSTDQWAPASSVRHPWVRVGRWTLLYRRAA